MKPIYSLILIISVLLSVYGCGRDKQDQDQPLSQNVSPTTSPISGPDEIKIINLLDSNDDVDINEGSQYLDVITNPSDKLLISAYVAYTSSIFLYDTENKQLLTFLKKFSKRTAILITQKDNLEKIDKKLLLEFGENSISSLLQRSKNNPADTVDILKTIVNFKPSKRKVSECGVLTFKSKREVPCESELDKLVRSSNCKPERFNSRRSRICPGYRARSTTTVRNSSCPSGWRKIGQRKVSEASEADNPRRRPHRITYTTCELPEIINTCRRKEFDVEIYQKCRHPLHGVEIHKLCSHKSFGVEEFKECEIIKTRDELDRYLDKLENDLPFVAHSLISHKANMARTERSPGILSCFIQKWKDNKNANELISDLMSQFIILTGENYENYRNTDCLRISISDASCTKNDVRPYCKHKKAYEESLKFLEQISKQLAILSFDKVPRERPEYMDMILERNDQLLSILKNID